MPDACFRALVTGCSFSRAWCRMLVYLRLVPDACFRALVAGCLFSRAWCRMLVFPCLVPDACFPVLGAGCLFSRAWCRMLVFARLPRLEPNECFLLKPHLKKNFPSFCLEGMLKVWRILSFTLWIGWFFSSNPSFVVFQIVQQFPSAFEFTSVYLVKIADQVNSQW